MIDASHDPERRSWVQSANGHSDFPLQNLPLGWFRRDDVSRPGLAIGESVLDLAAAAAEGMFPDDVAGIISSCTTGLNPILAASAELRWLLRRAAGDLLDIRNNSKAAHLLHEQTDVELLLPAVIGDYTDFYAGIHHAINVGKLFRPNNPLLPNYRNLPVGYHGRSSSIVPSGHPVYRPSGQQCAQDAVAPAYGPSLRLDFELELGCWIGAGNEMATAIPLDQAWDHIAGFCLLNDWSARDIQTWEYQPLGPFLAKNFATTISPWIVTAEALAPFRQSQAARQPDDPVLLDYLVSETDRSTGALSIALDVTLRTQRMAGERREAFSLSRTNADELYWTPGQMIAHHTSGGCNLRSGDLLGSGTISGTSRDSCGSLLEITRGGREAVVLPGGEQRTFLEDGDEVELRGHCHRDGFVSIGFGSCKGIVHSHSH